MKKILFILFLFLSIYTLKAEHPSNGFTKNDMTSSEIVTIDLSGYLDGNYLLMDADCGPFSPDEDIIITFDFIFDYQTSSGDTYPNNKYEQLEIIIPANTLHVEKSFNLHMTTGENITSADIKNITATSNSSRYSYRVAFSGL